MINLSEKAIQKVKQQIQKRGKGLGIMIGVKTTGCSGLAYKLEFVDNTPNPQVFKLYENDGVNVWVSDKDIQYLNGIIMDYKRQGLNEGFEFINPNEKDRCGCGESFRV